LRYKTSAGAVANDSDAYKNVTVTVVVPAGIGAVGGLTSGLGGCVGVGAPTICDEDDAELAATGEPAARGFATGLSELHPATATAAKVSPAAPISFTPTRPPVVCDAAQM
jgi:hypothetical protein